VTPYRSQPYHPHRYDAGGFDSGESALDEWLRQHAAGADARRTARTFVWTRPSGAGDAPEPVIAYYSLTGHRLVRDDLPRKLGRGSPNEIPAVLLSRLAVDRSAQGGGLGGAVLADALGRVIEATSIVAARFVVVDALHEQAATFCEHHGFARIPDTLRLIQKISDIAAALTRPPR
jgi:GNAT superfamily N-acetyltransferase